MINDGTLGLVEVILPDADKFLQIKETLMRLGIASYKTTPPTLFQSCHILHKAGKYYIVHFKEMFKLDGKLVDFSEDDRKRRNLIISLLSQWELCHPLEIYHKGIQDDIQSNIMIKIVKYSEKSQWLFETKYLIGKYKN